MRSTGRWVGASVAAGFALAVTVAAARAPAAAPPAKAPEAAPPPQAAQPAAQPAKPKVVLLATGGAIAGAQPKPGDVGYKSGAFSVDALIQAVPGMKDLAAVSG